MGMTLLIALFYSMYDPSSSFMLPNSLLREPVSRDWPLVYLELLARFPEVEDWQGTAAVAALETLKGEASLSALLRFRAEETERSARWRPLRPGTLARLADRSPEGTEDIRAPCKAVYPLFPRGACPHKSWAMASGLPQKHPIGNNGRQTRVIS